MGDDAPATDAGTAPKTPPAILFGIYAMLFGAATPFISEAHGFLSGKTGKNGLGIFIGWLVIGVVAAAIGIISTLIGCTQKPRTSVSHIAVMIALVEIGAVLYFFLLA